MFKFKETGISDFPKISYNFKKGTLFYNFRGITMK